MIAGSLLPSYFDTFPPWMRTIYGYESVWSGLSNKVLPYCPLNASTNSGFVLGISIVLISLYGHDSSIALFAIIVSISFHFVGCPSTSDSISTVQCGQTGECNMATIIVSFVKLEGVMERLIGSNSILTSSDEGIFVCFFITMALCTLDLRLPNLRRVCTIGFSILFVLRQRFPNLRRVRI